MTAREEDVRPADMGERNRARIAKLNDALRYQLRGGRLAATNGVMALKPGMALDVIDAVRLFADFDDDNDPYGEHDFGALSVGGERIFWKIDYYNSDMTAGSPDPADEALTTRVLTIMLASEY